MAKTLRVGLDIDGVLADFNTSFRKVIHDLHPDKQLIPEKDFCPVWNYPQHYGYTSKEVNKAWDVIKSTNFWLDLAPYENLDAVWDKLKSFDHDGHDLYFVTSRVGHIVKKQTERWLERHLYFHPTVLISERKGDIASGLSLDYYLDDKPENYDHVKRDSPSTANYLITRQWNIDQKGYYRVNTVLEFLEKIK